MKSIEVSRIGPKRNAQPETAINSTWMNGVETVNNILRQNNITVSDDDEDMGEEWLNVGLGRWIGVPDDKTAVQFALELDDAGCITWSWTEDDILEMVGGISAPDVDERLSDGDELLPASSSADGGLSSRDRFLGVRCNRAAVCAFRIGGGIQTSYNGFIKVYDGLTQTRLWGFMNSGWVVNVAGHYIWSRTDKKVNASACDKNDYQCLVDALADNFDQYPRQKINCRDESVTNYAQGVTGKSEWQTLTKKPKKVMPFKC